MAISKERQHYLVLGYAVNHQFEPKAWLKALSAEELANLDDDDCVLVDPKSLKFHTLIFAQSGSGKSFAVGRLIEEITLRTRAASVVIDPNSDYSRIDSCNEELWSKIGYDHTAKLGPITSEPTSEEFKSAWSKRGIAVFSRRAESVKRPSKREVKLHISEFNPSTMFDAGALENLAEIESCHNFATTLAALVSTNNSHLPPDVVKTRNLEVPSTFLRGFEVTARLAFTGDIENFVAYFKENHGNAHEVLVKKYQEAYTRHTNLKAQSKKKADEIAALPAGSKATSEPVIKTQIVALEDQARNAWTQYSQGSASANAFSKTVDLEARRLFKLAKLFKEEGLRFYIGRLEYLIQNQFLQGPTKATRDYGRLAVLDLPTLPDEVRYAFVFCVLQEIWQAGQDDWERAIADPTNNLRSPRFVFLDEAHNLIPVDGDSQSAPIKGIVRKIAAEGRKYGIYLVLITQRPDKLDPIVVSECENKLIMKVGSEAILHASESALGFSQDQTKRLHDAKKIGKGRGFLIGHWSGLDDSESEQKVYIGARRTLEGGRDLDDEYWTTQNDYPPAPAEPVALTPEPGEVSQPEIGATPPG